MDKRQNSHVIIDYYYNTIIGTNGEGKGHPCTGTEALYRPYGPYGE